MSLTEEQRRAVDATKSISVVAGAGAGKTHMLTERYLHYLTEEDLLPLEVVAVAFTEKAAAELRSRIRALVHERMADREDAEAELEAAQISTIHALCARVCREHPDEAGVPADFSVLDQLRGSLWRTDRLADAMDEVPLQHYEILPYPLMQAVLETLLSDPVAAKSALKMGPDGWEVLVAEARESTLAALLSDPALIEARNTLRTCVGTDADRMEETRSAALSALSGLSAAHEAGENPKPLLESIDALDLRGGKKANWGEGELGAVREAIKTISGLVRSSLKRGMIVLELGPADEQLAGVLPILRDAYAIVQGFVSMAKRHARVLDFADLEVHALKALGSEEVRYYYRERWRAFLVDEFQDTNPVQAEILSLLTEGAKLTVVGDQKQSIYGFRRADVEVFSRFRERILAEGGDEIILSTSFRAHADLVSLMNSVFSSVLGEMRQDLEAHRELPPHEGPHVRARLLWRPNRRYSRTHCSAQKPPT